MQYNMQLKVRGGNKLRYKVFDFSEHYKCTLQYFYIKYYVEIVPLSWDNRYNYK